jgi:SAM-dependent methyltransferase
LLKASGLEKFDYAIHCDDFFNFDQNDTITPIINMVESLQGNILLDGYLERLDKGFEQINKLGEVTHFLVLSHFWQTMFYRNHPSKNNWISLEESIERIKEMFEVTPDPIIILNEINNTQIRTKEKFDSTKYLTDITKPICLDLGCGPWAKPGFIGVDLLTSWKRSDGSNLETGASLLWNLNHGIPFPGKTIFEIYCSHFLEHCKNPLKLLKEIHRVCLNGSKVHFKVPLFEQRLINVKKEDVKFDFSKGKFNIKLNTPNIEITNSSHEHITSFFPDWFEKNLDLTKFEIVFKKVNYSTFEKDGDKGTLSGIFELEIFLRVIK